MGSTFDQLARGALRVAVAVFAILSGVSDRAGAEPPPAPPFGAKTPVTLPPLPVKPRPGPTGRPVSAPKPPVPPPAAKPAPSGPSAAVPAPASPTPDAPPAPGVAAPATPPAGSDGSPERVIAIRRDRLTVRVTDVPLDEILREVTEPSKAEVKGAVKDPKPVTVDFADVPLQDGLTRLLGEQNFLLTYRENGTLRSLTLLGGPVEEPGGAQVVKSAPAPPPAAPTAAELLQRTVPVSGKLQEFLGQPNATLQQLMDITLRQEDSGLRLEAMRAGMNAIDTQPDMRASVVKSLESVDDHALAAMVRNLAPGHALEVTSQLAATSRTPEIRARSLRLLRTLNETPSAAQE